MELAVMIYEIVWGSAMALVYGMLVLSWGRFAGRREEERQWRFAAATSEHWIVRNAESYIVMERGQIQGKEFEASLCPLFPQAFDTISGHTVTISKKGRRDG